MEKMFKPHVNSRKYTKSTKRPYLKSVYIGFAVLFFMSMLFSTYLVKSKFKEEYEKNLSVKAAGVADRIEEEALRAGWDSENITDEQENFMWSVLSSIAASSDTKYQHISGAIYDDKGNLVAKSMNYWGVVRIMEIDDDKVYYPFTAMEDFFSTEELLEFVHIIEKYGLHKVTDGGLPEYLMFVSLGQRGEPLSIQIEKITWKADEDGGISFKDNTSERKMTWQDENGVYYESTDSEVVWEKINSEAEEEIEVQKIRYYPDEGMPGLKFGVSVWEKWMNNEYLQGFVEKIDAAFTANGYSEMLTSDTKADLTYPITFEDYYEGPIYTLKLRFVIEPWKAAIDYMKYVYLGAFIMMLACMCKVIYMTEKTYKQQAEQEERRRDFTNAIAHELKTPLSIIRGFAENLKENTIEEKKEYYLTQIVGQTDVMDTLVQEMLYVSKLDSEGQEWSRELLDMRTLIEEQIYKLESLIQEKNIKVQYLIDADFAFIGDKAYAAKAIWNLLSNAVEYNLVEGQILITLHADSCIIENTGTTIPKEELSKVFDMFYTGNKSRTAGEKHLGMGLYLAKQILEKHHLSLLLENTQTGVKVLIKRC